MKAILFVAFLLVFGTAAFAQDQQAVDQGGIEEVYLARDDGGKAGDQVSEFHANDVPIYCVVLLESDASSVVKMNFVAVKVAGVKPETKVVTASYTTKFGQNRVNFTGRPEGKWTPGTYRVDLFLNGKKVRDVEFEIKPAGGAINSGSSASAAKNFQGGNTPKAAPKKANPAK